MTTKREKEVSDAFIAIRDAAMSLEKADAIALLELVKHELLEDAMNDIRTASGGG